MNQSKSLSRRTPRGRLVRLGAPSQSVVRPSSTPWTAYLVIDCSGSMEGQKLLQASDGAIRYSAGVIEQGGAVGIITFNGSASLLLEDTANISCVESATGRLDASGRTYLADALELAFAQLVARKGRRSLVVVTDGKPDDREMALREGRITRAAGIEIVTIGTDDADTAFLRELASSAEMSIETSVARLPQALESAARLLLPPSTHD